MCVTFLDYLVSLCFVMQVNLNPEPHQTAGGHCCLHDNKH